MDIYRNFEIDRIDRIADIYENFQSSSLSKNKADLESQPEPWEAAMTFEKLGEWRQLAYDHFDSTKHGHARWFFGRNNFPQWLGYSLGYDLVGRFLERHPSESSITLAHEPHMTFQDALLPDIL